MPFADGKIDAEEWAFVQDYKKAKEKHADFDTLFKEVETKAAKLNKGARRPSRRRPAARPGLGN